MVRDRDAQQLAYVCFEDEPGRRSAAKLLTKDEARRIAVNIVKQPELLSDVGVCRFHFDLNQIAELPESATEARSRLGDNAMSSAAGFPHSVAVALGLFPSRCRYLCWSRSVASVCSEYL